MSEKNRLSLAYTQGVEEFVEFAIANNDQQLSTFPCPCVKCRNRKRLIMTDLKKHLVMYDIDQFYTLWALHGEKPSMALVEYPPVERLEKENEIESNEDPRFGIENLLDASYGVHEKTYVTNEGSNTGAFEEPYVANEKYEEYKRLATEKLYPTCEGPETTLSTIVELHNIKKQFGWSENSVTALLCVLKRWLLKGITLPEKYP